MQVATFSTVEHVSGPAWAGFANRPSAVTAAIFADEEEGDAAEWKKNGMDVIAVGGSDDRISFFGIGAGLLDDGTLSVPLDVTEMNAHEGDVNCVSWNSNGTLASAGDDEMVHLWVVRKQ